MLLKYLKVDWWYASSSRSLPIKHKVQNLNPNITKKYRKYSKEVIKHISIFSF
jgi:hypothetical protein